MREWGLICVVLLLVTITTVASSADPAPYLGVYSEVNEDPPGLRIQLAPASPAADAGLRNGDVILGIDDVMFGDSETPFSEQLTAAISSHKIGDVITIHVYRDAPEMTLLKNGEAVDTPWPRDEFDDAVEQSEFGDTVELKSEKLEQYIDLQATLGPRPDTVGEAMPSNDVIDQELFAPLEDVLIDVDDTQSCKCNVSDLISQLLSEGSEVSTATDDLVTRLRQRASVDDGYRNNIVTYFLRDASKLCEKTRVISDTAQIFTEGWGLTGYWFLLPQVNSIANGKTDPELETNVGVSVSAETSEELISQLRQSVEYSAIAAQKAFGALSDEDRQFIASQRSELSDIFSREHYVDVDDADSSRARRNVRLIELAGLVDYLPLQEANRNLGQIVDSSYETSLQEVLRSGFADRLDEAFLYDRETEYGRIVITGTGESWFTGPQPALHIDLGGDDFYTYTEGGGSNLDTPVGVIIDLGGNDAYESTTPFCQGSGSMGVSLLVDVEGDDSYIGLQWAQGSGFFGCGALIDMAGNDTYRGEEFCQAAAIFGTGLLIDYAGDDRFEAQMKSQGFGGSHAVGLLIDVAGDDYRYAKGKYPTGYGDPGIFDAWSQGCAMGFRGLASGGIAGVIDMAGEDYNEAGNFSQGGGYYFGYGFFHDMGWEDDVYVGSRYNQGFSAHQAVGCFLEDGGDDRYYTRQAVAQGLAWDECVTMFIDYGGDDYYDGGTGFSQGASAHNSMCIFWDVDGRDTYVYMPGQARAGGNNYHGGTSLSLFLDTGGDTDWYDSDRSGNDLLTGWPEHGFFADLPGTLEAAVQDEAWKELWQTYNSEE